MGDASAAAETVMGFDFGLNRIGVAVGNTLLRQAQPLKIISAATNDAKFAEIVGAGGHVRFTLTSDDGARIKAIAFRAATTALGETLLRAGNDQRLHIAGTLNLDHYQGRAEVQLRVTDVAEIPG